MKLEIGSGKKPHSGYKTIDIEEYAKPDYLGDFRTMNFSEIEEIRCHHLLEHFSRKESIEILKLWHSWLKEGGIIIIETPDLEGLAKSFSLDPEGINFALYGSQEADWAYHKNGWWKEKFEKILPEIGFKIKDIRIFDRRTSKGKFSNIEVVAIKC